MARPSVSDVQGAADCVPDLDQVRILQLAGVVSANTSRSHHQFGYGRRICQGMELVDAELTTACGAIAWGLSLKTKSNAAAPEPTAYTSLLITKPLPFDFELKPRSEARAEEIYRLWRNAKKEDPQLVSKYDRPTAAWE
jgi:cytochrome P450